jgi:hypothetical protein
MRQWWTARWARPGRGRSGSPRLRPGAAVAAPGAAAAPPARQRLVRRVALHRAARGARADVVLTAAADVERVYGRLARRGKTNAVAARDVRGQRAVLRFRGAPDLPSGTYTVHLTLVDAAGLVVIRRKRLRLP